MLPLFPEFGLENSILTAVVVGVLVLAFFTETFGWVFVGLVVPGYLASIFILHPRSGWIVVGEAVATWALSAFLAGPLSRTQAWSHFFGRERFFLIVLCSVLVRLLCELLLLPALGEALDTRTGGFFGPAAGFFSIGLVLVPLTANGFWKLGPWRGLFQVGVPVALTYGVLRLVLLRYTNLSFSSLELTYEDVALDFLQSPKTYIVLVCTALLATRFNLRYGWDFNGILVPALLALTWYTPSKLLATFAEVLVLVGLTRALLTLPPLRTANLEGPRKVVLVFLVGFLAKYALAWMLGGRVPGLKVTDLFGFGYLVPTLLAVKVLQKQVIARILVPTAVTSLAGAILGGGVSVLLGLLEPNPTVPQPPPRPGQERPRLVDTSLGSMLLARVQAERAGGETPSPGQGVRQLAAYSQLWRQLARWVEGPATPPSREVLAQVARLGLRLEPQPAPPGARGSYVLYEAEERLASQRGFGVAVLTPGAPGPVIEIPHPATEVPSASAGAALCTALQCRVLLARGIDRREQLPPFLDETGSSALALFHEAHRHLQDFPLLHIRVDSSVPRGQPVLHRRGTGAGAHLPLPVSPTQQTPPELPLHWHGLENLDVLRAHPADLWDYLLSVTAEAPPVLPGVELGEWLASREPAPRLPGAARSLPPVPTEAELGVLETIIASSLFTGLPGAETAVSPDARRRWLHHVAGLMDAGLFSLPDCAGHGHGCEVFASRDPQARPDLATLAVRTGSGSPRAVEVPHPASEPGSLWLGVELWRALDARVFLVASRREEPLTSSAALHSPFQALHQALHQALAPARGLVLQVRGLTARAGVEEDLILSLGQPVYRDTQVPEELRALFQTGAPLGFLAHQSRYHDGRRALAGLTDLGAQLAYSKALGGVTVAVLWCSEQLRGRYTGAERWLERLTTLDGRPPEQRPVSALFQDLAPSGTRPSPTLRRAFDALARLATQVQREGDVRTLARLRAHSGSKRVEVFYSPELGLPWLLLEVHEGSSVLRGQYFLAARAPGATPFEVAVSAEDIPERAREAWRAREVLIVHGARGKATSTTGSGR